MSSSSIGHRGGGGAVRARIGEPRSSATPAPPLRLVRSPETAPPAAARIGEPIESATDPRWVLAVRTAEQLEGTLLSPEKRQRLIRTGRVMGLTPFDCNLVIAIVQDQARRGNPAAQCPTAGEAQLRMVPRPQGRSVLDALRRRPVFVATVLVTTLLLIELMVLRWFL